MRYGRCMADSTSHVNDIVLKQGMTIPQVGFGTYQIPPEETAERVEQAIEAGYRHIDTAAGYHNEAGVGKAIRRSGLERSDIFVTTKLQNSDHGADRAIEALDNSRRALGLDVIDLYLIHWPVPSKDLFVETWRSMIRMLNTGAVRALGVSNFLPHHLDRLRDETGVTPVILQTEVHPSFSQPDVLSDARNRGVVIEAYSPLGQARDLEDPVILDIAERAGVTAAQAVLAWHMQRGRVVIPKTTSPERMEENLAAAGVSLPETDLEAIDALHSESGRIGAHPDEFE